MGQGTDGGGPLQRPPPPQSAACRAVRGASQQAASRARPPARPRVRARSAPRSYVPNAGDRPGRERLAYKLDFLARLRERMDALAAQGKQVGGGMPSSRERLLPWPPKRCLGVCRLRGRMGALAARGKQVGGLTCGQPRIRGTCADQTIRGL